MCTTVNHLPESLCNLSILLITQITKISWKNNSNVVHQYIIIIKNNSHIHKCNKKETNLLNEPQLIY